jgi:hypothetical protein
MCFSLQGRSFLTNGKGEERGDWVKRIIQIRLKYSGLCMSQNMQRFIHSENEGISFRYPHLTQFPSHLTHR